MRLFNIREDERFEEFARTAFGVDHEEAVLERWLERNPDSILEDSPLLIIGRQVVTNLGSVIDLLGVDRRGETVVIELKRDRTPRDTLAQALEYASFVQELEADRLEAILRKYAGDDTLGLAQCHRNFFELSPDEAVSFNKDQRIVLVGQRISEGIVQTASYLRGKGLRVTCLEFSHFRAEGGNTLLSVDMVVGAQPPASKTVSAGTLPALTRKSFLASLDDHGRPLFDGILNMAQRRSCAIRWTARGFSLNVLKEEVHLPVCYCYGAGSAYGQAIYTAASVAGALWPSWASPKDSLTTCGRKPWRQACSNRQAPR